MTNSLSLTPTIPLSPLSSPECAGLCVALVDAEGSGKFRLSTLAADKRFESRASFILIVGFRAFPHGLQMRRSPSSCAYRGRASPMKCARSISGECWANDTVDQGGRKRRAGMVFNLFCAGRMVASYGTRSRLTNLHFRARHL
jgi:hypothetical protein